MICGFCGREIPDEVGQKASCGQCSGGCRLVHCPWCGYGNPVLPGYLKRLIKPDKDKE